MTDDRATRPEGEVVVYETPDGKVRVDVRLGEETVWLTQQQMAVLFGRDRSVVARHIHNAFREKELDRDATSAKFAQVQSEGKRTVSREVDHFNLDVIISVGYRVKSLRGTWFRQWATRTLRDYLVCGYTLNERRLAERGLREARETLDLLARTLKSQALVDDTGHAVLELITDYADTWHLLYFVVKDHPFTDGNKRAASLLFLLYLKQEGMVHRLNPQALTALTLLIAESAPAGKDLMVRLIINLLAEPAG